MRIYQQITTFVEDGSGKWQEIFRISDEQSGMFENTIGSIVFTGSGLNDMTNGGTYTGTAMLEVIVKIDGVGSPDTFKWSINKGVSWVATAVPITGLAQTLQNGITITFTATTGHTIDESWSFPVVGTANIFNIKEKQEDLDLGTNKLAEDEFKFQINKNVILTEENRNLCLEALQFCLDAQNTANKRYVAYFMKRTNDALDNNTLIFAGVLLPEQQWEDLHIDNPEWAEITDAIREWKFTCRPYYEDLFADKEFKTVNEKFEQEWNGSSWEDDLTWKTANVDHRQGYWQMGSKYVKFMDLVNVNKVLRRYADILEKIFANEGKNIKITYDKTAIDGIFRPTRYWRIFNGSYFTHIIAYFTNQGNFVGGIYFPYGDTFLSGGGGVLKLGISSDETGGDIADDVSPFMSYRNIVTEKSTNYRYKEVDTEKADEMLWVNNPNIKTFTDFLYYFALNFGCFLRLYFKSPTEIGIEFKSRASICNTSEVFIRDAVKVSGEIQPMNTTNKDRYYGLAWYLASEGDDYYIHTMYWKPYYCPSDLKNPINVNKEGKRLLLTISPTLAYVDCQFLKNHDSCFNVIAHNLLVGPFGFVSKDNYASYSPGFHSAIYMKVSPYTINPGDNEPSGDYWTPAGLWQVNNRVYKKISDYLNELYPLEEGYYKKELNIEVPYLCNFSAAPDGSNPSWKNLQLGSKFTYDGIAFNVVSITRDFENKTTKIKLHKTDRFTFGTEVISPFTMPAKTIALPDTNFLKTVTAKGQLISRNIVVWNDDGTVSDGLSYSKYYKKIAGMAIGDISDGEITQIITEGGQIYCDDWSFIAGLNSIFGNVGQWIYLKKDDAIRTSACNLTVTPMLEPDGNVPYKKDLFARIGKFITPDIIQLDFSQQWILE